MRLPPSSMRLQIQAEQLQVLQYGARARQHDTTLRCGSHATRGPQEQGRAEYLLDLGQRLGHGRLAGGHLFRHPCQRSQLIDLQQQRKMAQLQAAEQSVHHVGGFQGMHINT